MHPLLVFSSGLLAGAFAFKALKRAKTPDSIRQVASRTFDQAQSGLRQVAVSGLTAVEKSSASLRDKLAPTEAPPLPDTASEPSPEGPGQ